MFFEEKSYLKQLLLIGMLLGLIAGGTCGFLESMFVIFTGFNIPFTYIPFVYVFDFLTCAVIGIFCGLVFRAIYRYQADMVKRFNVEIFFISLVLTGVFLYQGLALHLFTKTHLGLKIIVESQLAIIIFYYIYNYLKEERSKDLRFSTISLVSTIILIEVFIVVSAFLDTNFFYGNLGLKSIAANIILTFLLIVSMIIIDKVLSRYKIKKEYFIKYLIKCAITIIPVGLFVSIVVWFSVQPRFSVIYKPDKSLTCTDDTKINNKNPNIILIGIDTLRADHLSSYGYSRPTSPHIDMLAKEGITFKFAISQAPWTLPSFASLMTSLYPSQHGANQGYTKINKTTLTLQEVLDKKSYITAAFTGGGWISPIFGFSKGYQIFDDHAENKLHLIYKPIPYLIKFPVFEDKASFSYSVFKILDWLNANAGKDKSFFLFIHTYDVHNYFYNDIKLKPYLEKIGVQYHDRKGNLLWKNDDPFKLFLNANKEELSYLKALYDAEIMYTDKLLSKIFDELESLHIDNNTFIILTSDHGEGFNTDLKRIHHGGRLHQDQLHVPLIFKLPGKFPASKIINEQVQLIDILPTICDFLNIGKSPQFKGESFKGLIYGNGLKKERYAFSEELAYKINKDNLRVSAEAPYRMVSVIFESKKYIHSPDRDEFYNLEGDPEETINLVNTNHPYENILRNKVKYFIKSNKVIYSIRKGSEVINKQKLNEIRKKLESLGYLK